MPARPDEVVTGYPARLGARLPLADAGPVRTVIVVGVARPRHPVSLQAAIFLSDAEATRLAGNPGLVDAIGVLAGPGFDVSRLRAAAGGAQVQTGAARGAAEYPQLDQARTALIPVTAAFGGPAMFIAIFVVASTLGLPIQQREREIALLRAVAATPGQIRRMIAWEAAAVALAGSAAGIWPGIVLGRALVPALAALSPVGGFLASANLGAATRRFSSASTPLVLSVALSCTFLFSSTTIDHATTQQLRAGLTGQLAITSAGPGLPAAALADARATRAVRSAVALTSTTLGPCLGVSGTIPAQILTGGQGGGLDAGVTSGSLSALRGDTIALGRHVADATGARIGDRVAVMLGDGTPAHATVVAIYSRDLAFGDALLAPELAAGHQTIPLLNEILIEAGQPAAAATRLQALARRYPGLHLSDSASLISANDANNELNHWLGPLFVAMIFAFSSIAVLNTLIMIALRRRRELALLRLTGATTRQVRSMARWEAILIIAVGLGIGLAIAATALLPLSRAFTGGLRPYAPAGWLAAILGISALLALVALAVPTRQALRSRPVEAIGIHE